MNDENKKTSKLKKLVAGKGFYIVLSLCLVGIGVSGYYLAGSFSKTEEQTAYEPVSAVSEVPAVRAEEDQEAVPVMAGTDMNAAAAQEAAKAAASIRIWPMAGAVIKEYEMDQLVYCITTDDWRVHDGVDMMAYLGEPVMAVTSGTVTAVYEDDMMGTTVEIAHEGSVSSRYCNLGSVPTVKVGDTVAPGDVIGAVGDTALAECGEDPHLHFQIFREGVSVDPREYIG